MLQVIDPPMLRVFTENIKHELSKKRPYKARILEIEHSSFTPLIFQPQVEWLIKPPFFYKRLAFIL